MSAISALVVLLGAVLMGSAGPASAGTVIGTDSFQPLYTLQNGTLVACLDSGRASPGEQGWVPYNRTLFTAPDSAYLWWKYGTGPDAREISALSYLMHFATDVPHSNANTPPGSVSPSVRAVIDSMRADTAAHKGPYKITSQVTQSPTSTTGQTTVVFTIRSAANQPMSGVRVALARTGSATDVTPGSGTTNAAGQITVRYQLTNSASGGVRATATLPATQVALYLEPGASVKSPNFSSNRQRMVGLGVDSSGQAAATSARPAAPKSYVRVIKRDAQSNAALGGAQFRVETTSGTVLASGTTTSAGLWTSPALDVVPGTTVRVRETRAPAGYGIDTATKTVATRATSPGTDITFTDTKTSSILRIHKTDAQTGGALGGARFTVTRGSVTLASGVTNGQGNLDLTVPVPPGTTVRVTEVAAPSGYLVVTSAKELATGNTTRPTVAFANAQQGRVSALKTDAATGARLAGAQFTVTGGNPNRTLATITTNAQGIATSGYLGNRIKVGDRVSIRETKAPAGYVLAAGAHLATVTRDGAGAARWTLADRRVIGERIVVRKVDSATGEVLAGAKFTLQVQKVGTTTWRTVTGGALGSTVEGPAGTYASDSTGIAGVNGNDSAPTLQYGDKVRFTEVEAPAGYHQPVGTDAQVTGTIGVTGDLEIRVRNLPFRPNITTTATNGELGKMVVGGDTVTDAVRWSDFAEGTYTVTGQLMLIDGATVTPAEGVTSSPVTFSVVEGQASGIVQMPFTLPAVLPAAWAGKTLVVYESVTQRGTDGIYAEHRDATDEGQSVYVPQIGTTARNGDEDLVKMVTTGTLVDTIAYRNLQPGKEYTAQGEFQAIIEGNPVPTGITGSVTFTPEAADGTVDVTFQVPADVYEKYSGQTLVAFETVKTGDITVAIHADVNDQGQQVVVPKIGTTAVNADQTQGKVVTAGSKVIDTIAYTGLTPGVEYTADGEFQLVVGGKATATGIIGHAVFTPDTASGTVDVEFTMPADVTGFEGKPLIVFETVKTGDLTVAIHADVTDQGQTVYVPGIGTTARNADPDAGKNVTPGGVLVDTITYQGLVPGKEYVAKGEFQLVIDGKATPTGIKASTTFTPTSMSGTVAVKFQLPQQIPAAWLGQTLVAFETVTRNDVTVAIHADVQDEGQTVHVPAIGTTATNANAELGKTVTAGMLLDRVAYRGLEPGRQYVITGEFQLVVGGKAQPTGITGTTTFTPQYSAGTVDVEFEVSAALVAQLAGKSIVAFETIRSGGAVVAIHADIADQGQTVNVPAIGTTASNKVPELGKTVVAGGTLTDTISYSNLTVGKQYTARGEFQLVIDGKATPTGVRSTATFTPRSSTGSVTLEFKLPAKLPAEWVGQTLVAFETMSQSGVTVAIHADVQDEGQTVHVPAIGTTATNANAELGKTVTAGTLVDVVAYSNLLPGKQYRVAGEFQLLVDGKVTPTEITGSAVFTPSSSSGTVTVRFPVSAAVVAKYAGQNLVAFETLTQGGIIVAAHADASDEGQTVSVPKIGTTASNIDPRLGKTITAGKLIDVIAYTNLVPGKQYTATGEFQLIVAGKAQPTGITGTAVFTPSSSSGTVTVAFEVPAAVVAKYAGKNLVAFETVKQGSATVAIHADVHDAGQTVHVPPTPPPPPTPTTPPAPPTPGIPTGLGAAGGPNLIFIGIGVALVVLAGAALIVVADRRRRARSEVPADATRTSQ